MPSQSNPNPKTQQGLLKAIKALATMPAQVVFYGSALLAIAATGGVEAPGILGVLATTVGVNALSSMLERVSQGDNVPEDEIRKTVEETIRTTGIENLLTSNEFQRVTAHVFRQFDLLKYAVQKGEINIATLLSDQFIQHKAMLGEMQSELSAVREKIDALATREQGEEILKLVQYIPELKEIRQEVKAIRQIANVQGADGAMREILRILNDEAREGPRLFSLSPINQSTFNLKNWVSEKFKLILWCEHSHLPLYALNRDGDTRGIYEWELTREWVTQAAPYLRSLSATLGLILPIAYSTSKLIINDELYKSIENQLDLGKAVIEATMSTSDKVDNLLDIDSNSFQKFGAPIHAGGAVLRVLHAFLKAKDPGYGGLVRVMNKRQEFLWVHEKFAGEY